MNKQVDLLLTLRDNCNVIVRTLLNKRDLTGKTWPTIDAYDLDVLKTAEEITRELMYTVDPSTNPYYKEQS